MTEKKQETPLVLTPNEETKWTKILIFAGIASTLGSAVPAGYCIGVMNSPAEHIKRWCNETLFERYDWAISASGLELLWSSIVSIFLVGGAIGSLTGAWIADRFGRKGSYLLCCKLFIVGALCFSCCGLVKSVELLLIGRLIVGLGAGLTTSCLPMYLCEIAPLKLRGTLAVFCPMGLCTGVVLAQIFSLQSVFGSASHWNIALSFYLIFVILCYAPFFYYPESPKWLYIVKKDANESEYQLKRLRGNVQKHQIEKELQDMEVESQMEAQACGFGEVLKNKKLMLPLIIVCVYHGGQQFSGINAIFYYSVSIFRKAGLSNQAAEWANLGAGSLNLAVSMLGPILMAKINRRPLMMFSSFFCALALLSFAVMLYFIDLVSWFANGCIGCIFLYIFFFQLGVGPIPFFIGAELFEVAPRPVAMSMGSLSSWGCNFLIGMMFPSLQNAWGALVFIPFSIACVIIFLLTKFYLPETRGRDPSQVAPLMEKGFKSKVL